MKCHIVNKTNMDMDRLISMIEAFYPYARKAMEFNRPVDIELHSDPENADADFGKTAAYSPSEHKVILYVDNRHHKDVLRSLSHELVHHLQNCRGEFDREFETGPGYAQEDGHLRKMEEEAYLLGNLCLRDYEDGIKSKGLFEKLLKEWCR